MSETVTTEYVRTRLQTMIEDLEGWKVHINVLLSRAFQSCDGDNIARFSGCIVGIDMAITCLQQWLADLDKLEAHNNDTEQHAYNVGTRVETTLGPGKIEGLAQDGGYWVHLQKEGTTPHIDPEFLRPYIPTKTRGGIGSGLFGEPEPLEEVDDE